MTSPSERVSLTMYTSSESRDFSTKRRGIVEKIKINTSKRSFSDKDVEEICRRVEEAFKRSEQARRFVTYQGGQ